MIENYRRFDVGPDPFGRKWTVEFRWLQTAISIRHSDTVDVKFQLFQADNVAEKVVALPHVALLQLSKKAGRALTDPWCMKLAGLHIKAMIETDRDMEKTLVTVTPDELLAYNEALERPTALRDLAPEGKPAGEGQLLRLRCELDFSDSVLHARWLQCGFGGRLRNHIIGWGEEIMVNCPLCDAAVDVEEDELDEGDQFTCEDCGAELSITGTDPLEIAAASDDEEDEKEEDDDLDEDEEEEAEEEESEEEDEWK